jgi:hypothetical protein
MDFVDCATADIKFDVDPVYMDSLDCAIADIKFDVDPGRTWDHLRCAKRVCSKTAHLNRTLVILSQARINSPL